MTDSPLVEAAREGGGEGGPSPLLALLTRPLGWRRTKLFGSSARSGNVRRRADLITAAWCVLGLALAAPAASSVGVFEAALVQVIASLPSIVSALSSFFYDLLAVWVVFLLLAAAVRGHWRLVLGLVLAVPLTALAAFGVDSAMGVPTAEVLAVRTPVGGLPVQLVLALAVAHVASRHLSRPVRSFGAKVAALACVGALLLPATTPFKVVAAVLTAILVASVIRFVLGSPRTTVSVREIESDLLDLGVVATAHPDWATGRREAAEADGTRLAVRVVGRDDWDAEVLVNLWRLLWYRSGSAAAFRLSARQQVVHEGFLLLLAQSRGVPVTPLAAAGLSRTGDSVVATRWQGTTLADLDPTAVDDEVVARAWAAVHALHAAGIAHGRLGPDTVLVDRGEVRLGSFEGAEPISRVTQVRADEAQLLVTSALCVGPERAIAAAVAALDADSLPGVVAHLQDAALDDRLRHAVEVSDLSLGDLRAGVAEAAGIEVPELQKIRRVSWGALLQLGLIAAVAYILISQLADIGWDAIVSSVEEASLPVLLLALLFGQTPRVAQAAGKQAASPVALPLGRLTRLEFATTFVNLAMPSTAARAAMTIRFFQRSGATAAMAVSAGALDSVFGFLAQIALLAACLVFGLGTLRATNQDVDLDVGSIVTIVVIGLVLLVIAALVVWFVPKLRAAVVGFAGQLKEALNMLRSPSVVIRLFFYNVLGNLLFTLTMWIVLYAFGQTVNLADVLIVNLAVALFAGLIPVPGGVGVTEGALTVGFVAAGVPQDIAFAAALCYRICTFYLPPVWGYFAFASLRKERYL